MVVAMGLMESPWPPPHPTVTLAPWLSSKAPPALHSMLQGPAWGHGEDRDALGSLWPQLLFFVFAFFKHATFKTLHVIPAGGATLLFPSPFQCWGMCGRSEHTPSFKEEAGVTEPSGLQLL